MSNELLYVRFLQFSVLALTFLLIYGIIQAKKGNINLHRKINLTIVSVTGIAVVGLVFTIFVLGWKYKENLKIEDALINIGPSSMQTRITIHRFFSTPLFLSLLITTYTGVKNLGKLHKKSIVPTAIFWLGTLVTALLFF